MQYSKHLHNHKHGHKMDRRHPHWYFTNQACLSIGIAVPQWVLNSPAQCFSAVELNWGEAKWQAGRHPQHNERYAGGGALNKLIFNNRSWSRLCDTPCNCVARVKSRDSGTVCHWMGLYVPEAMISVCFRLPYFIYHSAVNLHI